MQLCLPSTFSAQAATISSNLTAPLGARNSPLAQSVKVRRCRSCSLRQTSSLKGRVSIRQIVAPNQPFDRLRMVQGKKRKNPNQAPNQAPKALIQGKQTRRFQSLKRTQKKTQNSTASLNKDNATIFGDK